jgi:flagellar hook-associated protein 2
MSSINFGSQAVGTGAGIDVQGLVDQAIAAASGPIVLLQRQQARNNAQSSALSSISSDLNSLLTAVNSLNDVGGQFNAQSATSSNTGTLTATADTTAAAGTHTVVVSSLATTSSYYTSAVTSSSTPLNTGSFDLTAGTTTTTITVDNTNNTLDGLAAYINSKNLGVSASVITDANGARLALVSGTTGAPGDLTVANNSVTGLTFTKAVTGANASLTVDGLPISSASNAVTGVLAGVTLNLVGPAPGSPVTLAVAPDTSKASDAINQFVAAYNKVVTDINAQFNVNPDGSGGGVLESDGTLREVQQRLLTSLTYSITGNKGIVNLSSLGVNLNNDGTLSLDSSKLQSNLSGNFQSVKSFLQGTSPTGFAANFSDLLNNLTDTAQGPIGLDLQGLTQTNSDITHQIADLQASLAIKRQTLLEQYSQVDATLRELPLLQTQIAQQLGSIR